MKRILPCLVLAVLPAAAGSIDVSAETYARVRHGAELRIDFSIWNYAANNPGSSPYPTHLGLWIAGQPQDGSGLFGARLESLDGSESILFEDPLQLSSGEFHRDGAEPLPIAVLSGSFDLILPLSERIFGDARAARFILRNLGDEWMVGLGPGYTVRTSVFEPGIRGAGARAVGGITTGVVVENPEPATWMLAAAGALLVLMPRLARRVLAGTRGRSRV